MLKKICWKDTSQELVVRGETFQEMATRKKIEKLERKAEILEKRRLKEQRRAKFYKEKAERLTKKNRKIRYKQKEKPSWYPPEWVFKKVKQFQYWFCEGNNLDYCIIFPDNRFLYANSNSAIPENEIQFGEIFTQKLNFHKNEDKKLCSELGIRVSFWQLPSFLKEIIFEEIGYKK
jgi:hypothetical protein